MGKIFPAYYAKNGRLIPTAKRRKELNKTAMKLKQVQYNSSLPARVANHNARFGCHVIKRFITHVQGYCSALILNLLFGVVSVAVVACSKLCICSPFRSCPTLLFFLAAELNIILIAGDLMVFLGSTIRPWEGGW